MYIPLVLSAIYSFHSVEHATINCITYTRVCQTHTLLTRDCDKIQPLTGERRNIIHAFLPYHSYSDTVPSVSTRCRSVLENKDFSTHMNIPSLWHNKSNTPDVELEICNSRKYLTML